uniref:Nucleoprotein n=1 Tax=Cacopsylla melanoneura TaxID=428564 RepID=A0A8D8X0W4_9HEMI
MDVNEALETFEKVMEKIKNMDLFPSEIKWSENMFHEKYVIPNKIARPSRSDIIQAARTFLHWYVGGDVGSQGKTIVRTLLFGMTLDNDNEYFVPDQLTNNTPIPVVTDVPLPDLKTYTTHPDFHPVLTLSYKCNSKVFLFQDVQIWVDELSKALDESASASAAINYIAYLALTYLRLMVKEETNTIIQVRSHLASSYKSIWKMDPVTQRRPPPPAQKFLSSGFKWYQDILAIVVKTATDPQLKSPIRTAIGNESCLQSLRYTGMGLYANFTKAIEKAGMTSEEFSKYLADNIGNIERSLKRVSAAIEKYEDPEKNEFSFRWARIFNSNAFERVSAKNNTELNFILMIFNNDGQDVKGVKQALPSLENQIHLKRIGNALLKCLTTNTTVDVQH